MLQSILLYCKTCGIRIHSLFDSEVRHDGEPLLLDIWESGDDISEPRSSILKRNCLSLSENCGLGIPSTKDRKKGVTCMGEQHSANEDMGTSLSSSCSVCSDEITCWAAVEPQYPSFLLTWTCSSSSILAELVWKLLLLQTNTGAAIWNGLFLGMSMEFI